MEAIELWAKITIWAKYIIPLSCFLIFFVVATLKLFWDLFRTIAHYKLSDWFGWNVFSRFIDSLED